MTYSEIKREREHSSRRMIAFETHILSPCNCVHPMQRLTYPYHANVMRLMGQVTQTEPILMVVEHMANGNLRDFLLKYK